MTETVRVDRREWRPPPPPLLRHHYAERPPDAATVIDRGPVRLIDGDGNLVAVVVGLGHEPDLGIGRLLTLLDEVTWDGTIRNGNEFRLSGFNNAHRVFGFSAPVPLRRRWGCSSCGFNREEPDVAERTERIGARLWEIFEAEAPDVAAEHGRLVTDAIHPDWHWGGAPWTSGIINRTAALPYHLDAGNLKGAWSAQLTLRRNSEGGLLHLPEYGVYLALPSRSVAIFPGQSVWHGVTPLAANGPRSYRYSMVFYAKAGCRACGPASEEPHRAAQMRTAREGEGVAP